jgi:hypothetical protein
MGPSAALWQLLERWRNADGLAWFIRGPVSAYLNHLLVLEFASGLTDDDLDHLTTISRHRINQSLNLLGDLFDGGQNRELHGWWDRAVGAIRTLAGRKHEVLSEAALKWLNRMCGPPPEPEEAQKDDVTATEAAPTAPVHGPQATDASAEWPASFESTTSGGPVVLEFGPGEVRFGERSVELGGKPLQILKAIYSSRFKRMTLQDIVSDVWEGSPFVSPTTARSHICAARKALRELWSCPGFDPIPCVDRGDGETAFKIAFPGTSSA